METGLVEEGSNGGSRERKRERKTSWMRREEARLDEKADQREATANTVLATHLMLKVIEVQCMQIYRKKGREGEHREGRREVAR